MASSEKTSRSYSRRFAILAAAIVAAIALYTGGWFYVAGLLERGTAAALANAAGNAARGNCEHPDARGYPFRIGIFCDSVSYADARGGLAVRAGAFRSAAQVYDPFLAVGELDGPMIVETRQTGPVRLDWESLRSSVRLAEPLPERLSIEAMQVAARLEAGDGGAAGARRIAFHSRPTGPDLEVALSIDGFSLDPALLGRSAELPPLDADADLVIADGVRLLAEGAANLRGTAATVRNVSIAVDGVRTARLSGKAAIDRDGLLDADLELAIDDAESARALIEKLMPQARDQLGAAFAGLSALGDTPTLPLVVRKGEMRLGFLPLGRVPPL